VVLVPGGAAPVYLPSGHLLYTVIEGGLFAVRFDLAKRRVDGAPARVLERVGGSIISRGYSVSASGVLVQRDAQGTGSAAENRAVMVDPGKGNDTLRLPPARYDIMRFSPDGRSLAMEVLTSDRAGRGDIYTLDLVTGTYTQLTFEGDNDVPVWSPDGTRLLFDSKLLQGEGSEELFIKPADNSAPARRVTMFGSEVNAAQWFSDTLLLFTAQIPGRGWDVFVVNSDSGSVPVPYLQSPANEDQPSISPDRRLITFRSNETGANQIWMRDFPVPQGKWNLSRGQGNAPRWSPDGRFVYFWRGTASLDSLFRVRIDRVPTTVVQAPELVVAMDADGLSSWDLHPDGRRFIVTVRAAVGASSAGAPAGRYLILQNWFGELRRLTAPRPE
jgi:hypothetical protein